MRSWSLKSEKGPGRAVRDAELVTRGLGGLNCAMRPAIQMQIRIARGERPVKLQKPQTLRNEGLL